MEQRFISRSTAKDPPSYEGGNVSIKRWNGHERASISISNNSYQNHRDLTNGNYHGEHDKRVDKGLVCSVLFCCVWSVAVVPGQPAAAAEQQMTRAQGKITINHPRDEEEMKKWTRHRSYGNLNHHRTTNVIDWDIAHPSLVNI